MRKQQCSENHQRGQIGCYDYTCILAALHVSLWILHSRFIRHLASGPSWSHFSFTSIFPSFRCFLCSIRKKEGQVYNSISDNWTHFNSAHFAEYQASARHLVDPGNQLWSGGILPSLDETDILIWETDNKKYAGSSSMARPSLIHSVAFSDLLCTLERRSWTLVTLSTRLPCTGR